MTTEPRAGDAPASAPATGLAPLDPQPVETSFDDLGLVPDLLRGVQNAGYSQPTPIQAAAIGPAIAGRDVIACAQTGTGKTAAFALPMLQRIWKSSGEEPEIRGLVLTPTRELAAQIGDNMSIYGKHLDLWHSVIFGGVSDKKQIAELKRGVDVLVATPGRLLDLLQQRALNLSHVEMFVLDEADRMLDMGFLPDVKRVIAKLPERRQTMLFSATMPSDIRDLASRMMAPDTVSVAVDPVSSTVEAIEQRVYFVDKSDKRRLLLELLKSPEVDRTLVFSRTKHGANRIAQFLEKSGVDAAAIHGNKSQGARTRALDGFRRRRGAVLVATDIAARGIDVEGVSHVVNYDLPNVAETYVHRIGRTGRAGASGLALSFCDADEREDLRGIERLIGTHLDRVTDHPYPPGFSLPPETDLTAKGTTPRSSSGGRAHGGGARRNGGGRPSSSGGSRGRSRRGGRR